MTLPPGSSDYSRTRLSGMGPIRIDHHRDIQHNNRIHLLTMGPSLGERSNGGYSTEG